MSEEPYCKVSRRMWSDESFRRLSDPQPNGKSLWQYLLTGPHYKRIPGVFVVAIETMAADNRWPIDATKRVFQEIIDEGMARYDPETKLLWLPAALHHNRPSSVNVITSWAKDWHMLPECHLLREATASFRTYLAGMSQTCLDTFDRTVRPDRPSVKAAIAPPTPKPQSTPKRDGWGDGYPQPSRNQDQDLDQEQKSDLVCEVDLVPDTKRAHEHTHAHTQESSTISPDAGITREHIATLIGRYPILQKLWPEHHEHLYFVASAEHCLRFGQVQRAFQEWFAKRAPSCGHLGAPGLLGDVASFIGSADMRRGGRPSGPSNADIAAVFAAFDPVWCKHMKCERRPKDARDEWAAEHIAAEVKEHAKSIGAPRWGEVLRHVLAAYFALDDRWLESKRYPLCELQNRLSGLLGPIKQKPAKKPELQKPAPPPQPTPAERAAMARQAQADFERLTRAHAAAHTEPNSPQAPPAAPSAPIAAQDPSRAQEGAFPGQQQASSDLRSGTRGPYASEPEAGPDPPKGVTQIGAAVVSLMPRLRGGGR